MFQSIISYHYGQKQCNHNYLAHYVPVSHEQDSLSKSLLRFKHGELNDLPGWINYANSELANLKMPDKGIIIRALHSYETHRTFARKPLDYLGHNLARQLGWDYKPRLLQKGWHTQKAHHLFTVDQRKDEFRDSYYLNDEYAYMPDTPVLVIDDIVTTGVTMMAILNAFNEVCASENLTVFSLAKTSPDREFNLSLNPQGRLYSFNTETGWFKKDQH